MRNAAMIRPRLAAWLAMMHIRRRVKMKKAGMIHILRRVMVNRTARTARTVSKSARKQVAGTSNSQDRPNPLLEETRRYLGLRDRGKGGVSLEIRWSPGPSKLHAGYFQNREHAAMAHDVARRCHLGKDAYLQLPKAKLNHWETRGFLADWFCGDRRMEALAEAHRRKEDAGQKWDEAMKATLRKLASDALALIKPTAQEESATPQQSAAIDGQNNNGNLSPSASSDEGLALSSSRFDVDGALVFENGAVRANWARGKESPSSISPWLPEGSLEEQMEELRGKLDRLKGEDDRVEAENFADDALNLIGGD